MIRIGHPAYGAWCFNNAVYCRSKSAAVRELCNRFVPRSRARQAVNEAVGNGYGAFTYTVAPNGIDYGIELEMLERTDLVE